MRISDWSSDVCSSDLSGMKGVFAPVGSYVPGTDLTLKAGKIRGEESNGMLVSERELGLSDEHEGIIELSADTPLGAPFAEVMGFDAPVIEIAITLNRGDCLGVRGVARDLAAAGLRSEEHTCELLSPMSKTYA